MYDPLTTRRKIQQAIQDLKEANPGEPEWKPKYHSLAQIDHAIAHLDALWDPEEKRIKRPSGKLTREEAEFIQNERRLCALDFRGYWAPNYAWIINWEKKPVTFTSNIAQNIVMDLWAEDERAGNAIWMQQLKARRLGVSTISELNVTHRFLFQMDASCVVASADIVKTNDMAAMIKFCLDKQPWWLMPQGEPQIKGGIPVSFPDTRTKLTFQAGNQTKGIAQGSTPNVIHLSECCLWNDPEGLIDTGLMPAVLDTADVFGIFESTAQGPGWWKDLWELNKRDWSLGTGRMRPVFLPWFVGTDLYPTTATMRKNPMPATWIPADRTVAHAERAREYVLSNPLLFKHLAKGDSRWVLPRHQMHWWELKYETARQNKKLHIFLAQYCSDDFEAFQSVNVPIIDTEILLGYDERSKRRPLGAYTIIGPDIPPALIIPTRHWDSSQPPIPIHTREVVPNFDAKYQLIPVKFEGWASFDWELKLLIWGMPEAGASYGVGVDTSEGIGQDRAVISALRESSPTRGPGQVAEWASAYVTAFQLWPFVMALGCLYSTFKQSANKRVQCRLAIEAWANGAACQFELQKRGWGNFHPWKTYDNRKNRPDGEVNKLGVYTNQTFRAQMFDMLLTNLSEEAIDLPSPYLIEELKTLERAGDRRRPQAAPDAYDDRVMAVGFPLFSLHMGKPPSKQFSRKRIEYVPGGDPEVKPNYAVWQSPHVWREGPNAAAVGVNRRGSLMELARNGTDWRDRRIG